MTYPVLVARLIEELGKLPGIGPKTAQRLSFHLLNSPLESVKNLARAIIEAREGVCYCSLCGNLADGEKCAICQSSQRNDTVICVVEKPHDLIAMEKAHSYKGLYHVLHGVISPMEGISPEDLNIKTLLQRLQGGKIKEVILATNPNIEGDATALYLSRLISPLEIKITRIAYGLPVGASLEYADQATLSRAMEGRQQMMRHNLKSYKASNDAT